jgi:hypothetical protein
MALPDPAMPILSEAARLVADRCGVSTEDAQARLYRAFRDRELVPVGAGGRTVDSWDGAAIDWDSGSVTWPVRLGDGGHTHSTLPYARVGGPHLDEWMAQGQSDTTKRAAAAWLFAEPV